ncbi:MAG: elongation factor Ts [Ruminococcaceae bacterium]|nr:elongation factor Ts [Oscillospiraceae bacterium]
MANITAKDVAELRSKTGAGMMDCKKALVEADGNLEEAVKILREKGLSAAAKKQSRIAADGLVDILKDGNITAMIEVNTETDFVAKNDLFKEFVKNTLAVIIKERPTTVEELANAKYDDAMTVNDKLQELIFIIKEKITIRRFVVFEGVTGTYIHGIGAIGVVVAFDADEAAINNAGFPEFAKNIALQVAAVEAAPYLDRASVPASVIEEEKNIIRSQIANDPKNAKKPANIIDKMIEGKLGKFYENNCLVEMEYFKDDDLKVSQYIANTAKELGGNISIKSFCRYDKGEGIQKREDNFAEEIAQLTKGAN